MIEIFENRIPPIPVTYEGWDAWSLWDLRNFLAVMLLSPNNDDRRDPTTATGIDAAVASVYDEAYWPQASLGTHERSKKIVLIETLGHRLPRSALFSLDALRNLWATIAHRSQSAWDIAGREVRSGIEQVPQMATDAARKAGDIAEKAAPGLGLGLGMGLVALLALYAGAFNRRG